MKVFDKVGLAVPMIMLPKDGIDLTKWAVVACDQFTSEPEYWERVDQFVGNNSSTLRLILPEVYLEEPNKDERIKKVNQTMHEYLDNGVLEEKFEGFVYVERTIKNGKIRKGLIVALDLEKYDYHKGAKSLVRATEKTVEERIPPRVAMRENALIELPHIMVLVPDLPVKEHGELIYDFDLMMGGGHIKGYKIDNEKAIQQIVEGLLHCIRNDTAGGFLYAMGDGNHSLAAAKACGDGYALVELVDIHDEALEFEAIHRVVFDAPENLERLLRCTSIKGGQVQFDTAGSNTNIKIVKNGIISDFNIKDMGSNLAVGNLQILLDSIPNLKIDYVHGEDSVKKLAVGNNIGFILPVMEKDQLFPTVAKDGALPRKTFSMGEASEKRYYLEARKIK